MRTRRLPFDIETLPTSDGHIVIAAGNDRLFVKLASAIDLPELARDSRFADNAARVRHRDELAEVLARRLSERSTTEWLDVLTAARIPVGTVKDVGEIVADPQFNALGIFLPVPHQTIGTVRVLAPPISYHGVRLPLERAAPPLGADTRSLMTELGYAPSSIEDLAHRGLIRIDDGDSAQPPQRASE